MNKSVKTLVCVLVVSGLILATGILTQNNRYLVSINVNIMAASDSAKKYLALFQKKTLEPKELWRWGRVQV